MSSLDKRIFTPNERREIKAIIGEALKEYVIAMDSDIAAQDKDLYSIGMETQRHLNNIADELLG